MSAVDVLNALKIFVCIFGGLFLCGRAFSKVRIDPKMTVIAAAASVAAAALTAFADTGSKQIIVMTVVEVAVIWICSLVFWKADRRMALFAGCVYKMGQHMLSLLSCAAFAAAQKEASYLDLLSIRGCIVSLSAAVLITSVCAVVFFVRSIPTRFWIRVWTVVAMASVLVINYLLSIDSPVIDREDLYIWLYFDLGLMISVMIVQMRKQYETEKELAAMKSEEAMMLEREYHSLSSSYERNAKLFHDFRNHCGVIRNYLANDRTDEAVRYLDDLTGGGSSYGGEVWTGDGTIDYLIGSKKSAAAEKDISFEVNAEFPRNINIKSSDLCAILGNLLDNAIEACCKIPDPSERKIRLIIRRIGQMLVLKVENTFADKPVIVDGEYRTGKNDGGLHGWGIKSARTAAEKYDGTVISSVKDDVFSTVVTLSFEGIRPE